MGIDFEQQIGKLQIDFGSKSLERVMSIWFTDLESGFCLMVKGADVHYINQYSDDTDLSISLNYETWKEMRKGSLNIYDAINTGKLNHIGDRWEVIRFFEMFK